MKKLIKPIYLVLLAALAATSCNHRYYAPNSIQTPFLQNQHDANVSGGMAFGPEYSGWEAQAVYSPIKKIAVIGSFFTASSKKDKINDLSGLSEWGRGYFYEGGIGGYHAWNEHSVQSVFVGAGKGNVFNYFGNDREADLDFQRLFLQTGIALQYKYLHLGFGLRLCHLNFVGGDVDLKIDDFELDVIKRLQEDSPMLLAEYSFNFGWKIGPVRLHNILTYSPSNAVQKDARFAGNNISLSASLDLHHFWKKK